MKKSAIIFISIISFTMCLMAQNVEGTKGSNPNDPKMEWWKEARFGMFIHWGLYSVPAGSYDGKQVKGLAEWIMHNAQIPVVEYKKYASQFNPQKFNAEEWVKLAKAAGMKYIVLTSKHHDGFAMFKSEVDPFNIVDATPFKRDVVKELAAACKKYDLKLGLYYSQSQDWTAPGGASARPHWDSLQNGDMGVYIDKKVLPQLKEILSNYGEIPILWFDTPKAMTKTYADKIYALIKEYPNLIYNNRLGAGYGGDLHTPEQYIPATGYPGENWESCMTMNGSWGYKSYDNNWKSSKVLIQNLIDIVSKGGNYLLNVGPTDEGLIPQPSVDRLKDISVWLDKNKVAIYGTTASPFVYLKFGRCTRKNDKLYLHVLNWPKDGIIRLPMENTVVKASFLNNPKIKVPYKKVGKYIEFKVPAKALDSVATVLEVKIEGEPKITIPDPIPSFKKPATASSEKDNSTKASFAFDSNGKKGWVAADGDKTAWLSVNLGKETSIGSISMTEAGSFDKFVKNFKLEYKDGENWKTIFEDNTIGAGYFKAFKPVVAREFRINILESSKTPQLKEVQLYFDE